MSTDFKYSDLPQEIVDLIAAVKLMAAQFPVEPCGRVGVDAYYVETLRRRLEAAGFEWRATKAMIDRDKAVVA